MVFYLRDIPSPTEMVRQATSGDLTGPDMGDLAGTEDTGFGMFDEDDPFGFRPVAPDGTYSDYEDGFGPNGPAADGGGGSGMRAGYIPTTWGGSGAPLSGGGSFDTPTATWVGEQLDNARIIMEVGSELGASQRDIQIALMTAMQESTLRNLNYGDRDSVGLFQQRDAWGSFADRTDPRKSAEMFFTGGQGGQRGLFDFPNRDQMSLTEAAQAVQVSAYPDAYAKWEADAAALFDLPEPGPEGVARGWRAKVIEASQKMLGVPYVWGGTNYNGVDCSGLVQLMYRDVGIDLPRVSFQQANSGERIALEALQPGDLVAWDNSSRNSGADHIAIYIGNGKIIEAPRPGGVVQINTLYDTERAWGVSMAQFDTPDSDPFSFRSKRDSRSGGRDPFSVAPSSSTPSGPSYGGGHFAGVTKDSPPPVKSSAPPKPAASNPPAYGGGHFAGTTNDSNPPKPSKPKSKPKPKKDSEPLWGGGHFA